jgi:inner membrane protein
MALWAGVSLLPDVDVIGFALGVEYADPWGHRGATHSLTLAIALGLTIGLLAPWLKRPAVKTALVATGVLASHGLLDTMTDGGLGCALLWPFDLTRYFAPWRPIPVAPIGLDFFSIQGVMVALTELVLFSPVLVFALRSRSPAVPTRSFTMRVGALLALWLVSVWLISSGRFDPARDAIMGFALREDTAYASGFSEEVFRTLTLGESDREVRRHLGVPFGEMWFMTPLPARPAEVRADQPGCVVVRFEKGAVVTATDVDACKKLGIETGMSSADVHALVGSPADRCWQYTWSPRDAHYRERTVCFTDGRVMAVIRQWR